MARTLDIEDGEDIASYFEGISDGETIEVPEGTYDFSGATISASNCTVNGNEATLRPTDRVDLEFSGDSWKFGGFVFDQTVNGNTLGANPSGSDWEFHHIGWKGSHSEGNVMHSEVTSSGGMGEVHHIYCNLDSEDHDTENWDRFQWTDDGHVGEQWFKQCYLASGGLYGVQSSGVTSDDGTTNVEQCYFDSNNIHNIRTGHPTKECQVKDTVIDIQPERVPEHIHDTKNSRGIWAWYGNVVVENTHIMQGGDWLALDAREVDGDQGTIEAHGGNVVGDIEEAHVTLNNVKEAPRTKPLDVIPISPEEAADVTNSRMTQKVIPSYRGDSDAWIVSQLVAKGAQSEGWIQESNTALLADDHRAMSNTPLNAFDESHSSSSFDVTIDTGEAFVQGAWLAKDTTTTVTLNSDTNGQKVYLGWAKDSTDKVLIGLNDESEGDPGFDPDDPKMVIWTFDTDGSGVTDFTDERQIGQSSSLGEVNISSGSKVGRFLSTALGSSANGVEGNSNNEVARFPGTSSDLIHSVQDGSGKMNIAYNCYYDGSDWRFIVGNESAYRIEFDEGVKLHSIGPQNAQADNTANFHTLHINHFGDLYSDDTQFYNHQENEVLQDNLQGPASDLSSYPLPPGDLDTGSGSGLNADKVDGMDAGDLQGGTWTSVMTHTDEDSSTPLDFDTGTMNTVYDIYKVQVIYLNQVDDFNELQVRVQNDGSSSYRTTFIGDSADVSSSYNNYWSDIAKTYNIDAIGHAEILIRGGSVFDEPGQGDSRVSMSVNGWGESGTYQAQGGHLDEDYNTVDRISVQTPEDATAKIKVLGTTL